MKPSNLFNLRSSNIDYYLQYTTTLYKNNDYSFSGK